FPGEVFTPPSYVLGRYVNSVGVPALGAQPRNRVTAPATDVDNAQRLAFLPSVLELPAQIPLRVFPRGDGLFNCVVLGVLIVLGEVWGHFVMLVHFRSPPQLLLSPCNGKSPKAAQVARCRAGQSQQHPESL